MIALAAFTFASCEDVPMPYDDPNNNPGGGDEPGVVIEPSGSGTKDDPYNVAAALQKVTALAAGEQTEPIYVKGTIKSIKDVETAQYGNANYYITDDGSNEIYIFQSYYLGNKKFTSEDQIKVGDEVVIYGPFTNYMGNTPETVGKGSSYIYSLNGKTEGGEVTPPVEGTYINETFASSFGSFTVKNVKGTPWVLDSYGYAKATGYDNASKTTTPSASYLVSSAVNMSASKEATVSFEYILRYVTTSAGEPIAGISNKVLVTDKYTGDPATTDWTDITGTLKEVRDWKTWTKFTAAVPSNIIGKENVVFALYYSCEDKSGTWEVKNLTVKEGKEEGGSTGGDSDTGDVTASNGDFETWVDGLPNNWKTASTAGNATLSQSTDAHGGKYSVKVGGTNSANKRIGYKEIELKAGEYTMTFYAKAATSTGASVRPGYVQVTDGKVGNYMYSDDYTNNISNGEWILVTHTFSIPANGTYCLVIMNSKNPGADVLIDDFILKMGDNVIIK